ncbi:MAG TPA: DUF4191 domain-containing protein [Mycobacteriales bacterium]|nr:DUF4191 domain-containing protein [Mycobacteriales bacterium]
MALLGRRKSKKPPKAGPTRREKWAQVKLAFSMTRKADPKMLPLVISVFVITLAVLVGLGVVLDHPVYLSIIGVLLAAVLTAFVFGRRVQRTAYSQVEGQMGAAAAVLQNMRGNWRVTPAVQFNRDQDMIHRVIGRPGVVLVGEGNANRLRGLAVNEKRALARIVGDTPIYDVVVGDGEGQVSLRELEKHFLKLPRNIKPAMVNQLNGRLKAMRAASGALPVPKGPMPTRVPRGKVR